MKKFYTFALAAAVAVTASAAVNVHKLANPEVAEVSTNLKVRTATVADKKVDRPAKLPAADYEGYNWVLLGEGKYVSSAVAGTYGGSTDPVDVQIYEAEGHTGVYKAVGVWPDLTKDGQLIVDASNPDFITVPKQYTGVDDDVDNETYIASQTWTLSELSGYEPSVIAEALPELLPTLDKGCIYFPAKALVLNWPNAPADSKYGTDATKWYTGGDVSGYLLLPGGQYVDPWTLLGEGTFTGDVYFKTFGMTASDYTVNVYKSNTNENLYRVENPLKGLYAALNYSGESPKWEIETDDANNISLPLTSSGINGGSTDGLYYVATYNQALEDVTATPEEYRAKVVKESTKTTFTFPTKSLILYASTAKKIYFGNTTEVILTINHDDNSVNDIIADEENNAPVEFFNLQGQRVNNPAAGQLVIRRQGTKVAKVLVK